MPTKTKTAALKADPLAVPDAALLALARLSHLGLSSNKATKALRSGVKPGQHTGTRLLSLTYDITVGEDAESEVAQSVPWKSLAGILFSKLNAATRDAVIREVLEASEGGGFQLKGGSANEGAEGALALLMGMTKKTVAGRVTGSAILRELEA